jgi:hypothetical protein
MSKENKVLSFYVLIQLLNICYWAIYICFLLFENLIGTQFSHITPTNRQTQ